MRLMHVALGGCLKAPPVRYGLTEDTGGHIAYVLGLVQALASERSVAHVDVVTRRFRDPSLGEAYDVPSERLGAKARILRLRTQRSCYLSKEDLARELDSFTDALLDLVGKMDVRPDVLHAHFADAALAARAVRDRFDIPFIFTAHSLGLDKRDAVGVDVSEQGGVLCRRIAQEEEAIAAADAIIASSRDEAERQLMQYAGADAARIHRLSPGVTAPNEQPVSEDSARELIAPFLRDPDKAIVLAIARPVAKKNLDGLIDIFAARSTLRARANLVLLPGLREDFETGPAEQNAVFARIAERIDAHDLYGHVAYPKRHDQAQVQALYRLAARSGGVFVNPAFNEPFGLTLVEAAHYGLPVVATSFGGAGDIVEQLSHGFVADPNDLLAFATAIESLLTDSSTWRRASRNGRRRAASMGWPAYVPRYLKICEAVSMPKTARPPRMLFCDIDGTLTGSRPAAARFADWRIRTRGSVGFAIATGRSIDMARTILAEWKLPKPDVYVTSVGSEIYWTAPNGDPVPDRGYSDHIGQGWNAKSVERVLKDLPGLRPQAPREQRRFKRSYFAAHASVADCARQALSEAGLAAHVIFSHGSLLDVLPIRAGKGAALGWCARQLDLPMANCMAAGDSGNDLDMLTCGARAIVVANASDELASLKAGLNIYRAKACHADGVLEGVRHLSAEEPWGAMPLAPPPIRGGEAISASDTAL